MSKKHIALGVVAFLLVLCAIILLIVDFVKYPGDTIPPKGMKIARNISFGIIWLTILIISIGSIANDFQKRSLTGEDYFKIFFILVLVLSGVYATFYKYYLQQEKKEISHAETVLFYISVTIVALTVLFFLCSSGNCAGVVF